MTTKEKSELYNALKWWKSISDHQRSMLREEYGMQKFSNKKCIEIFQKESKPQGITELQAAKEWKETKDNYYNLCEKHSRGNIPSSDETLLYVFRREVIKPWVNENMRRQWEKPTNEEAFSAYRHEVLEKEEKHQCIGCSDYFDYESMLQDDAFENYCCECYEELMPVIREEYETIIKENESTASKSLREIAKGAAKEYAENKHEPGNYIIRTYRESLVSNSQGDFFQGFEAGVAQSVEAFKKEVVEKLKKIIKDRSEEASSVWEHQAGVIAGYRESIKIITNS